MRIGLATLPFPSSVDDAVRNVSGALSEAARSDVRLVCTPENYLPGLRGVGLSVAPAGADQLNEAFARIGDRVRETGVALILGTEFPVGEEVFMSALVYSPAGQRIGRQDKVQLDPSEEGMFARGTGRSMFEIEGISFGICICHEGWRYPETVRWSAVRGAQVVFQPHFGMSTTWGGRPTRWAEERNSMHEKAAICRAAENTIYFATVNYALPASQTTSAVVNPDGSLLVHQPYGIAGLLVADIDPASATGLLASRYRAADY